MTTVIVILVGVLSFMIGILASAYWIGTLTLLKVLESFSMNYVKGRIKELEDERRSPDQEKDSEENKNIKEEGKGN